MTLMTFNICIVLLLLTLLFDLWVSRTLRRGMATRTTKAVLAWWPLQVFLHLAVVFFIASARPAPVLRSQVHVSRRSPLGPVSPSLPPRSLSGKKARVEHL